MQRHHVAYRPEVAVELGHRAATTTGNVAAINGIMIHPNASAITAPGCCRRPLAWTVQASANGMTNGSRNGCRNGPICTSRDRAEPGRAAETLGAAASGRSAQWCGRQEPPATPENALT